VNVNPSILSFYVRSIVPRVTAQASLALASLKRSKGIIVGNDDGELEDDGNYGSAATVDVEVLQAISKRVHYGPSLFPFPFSSPPPHPPTPHSVALLPHR
jgi:chorismate mutase